MSGTATPPVIAGLVVGIGLVVIFAVGVTPALNIHNPKASSTERTIVTVVIPKGASTPSGNFEPSIIKVVIGVNNTVRWTNNDEVPSSVIASNPDEDPDFAAATEFPSGSTPANATNYLQPGGSFEFTFTRPGVKHYHSEPHPWMQGTVIVLSPLSNPSSSLTEKAELAYDKHHDDAFDFPYKVVNGIAIPTKNDTAIKEIIPYPKYNKELFKSELDFCRDPATFGNGREGLPYGDPYNPAVVVASSKEPAVISFCIHNNSLAPERLFVALDRMLVPMGQVNSTGLEGLNIALNTRVVAFQRQL